MNINSRSMRMLQSVARKNKELATKLGEFRKKNAQTSTQTRLTKNNEKDDPDFEIPSSSDTSSSEEGKEEVEPELPSIIIHQNVVIRPRNAIPSDSNNNNVIVLVTEIVDILIGAAIEQSENREASLYTKTGQLRKRRRFSTSLQSRKKQKVEDKKNKHLLKDPCGDKCKKRCTKKISEEQRANINLNFWQLTDLEQKTFVLNMTERKNTKRKASLDSRRSMSFTYRLKDDSGTIQEVCKIFFLATLGYLPNNDRIIRSAFSSATNLQLKAQKSRRGCTGSSKKIDRAIIRQHIESFNPSISHYRREHAPNRRYLPSDVTIVMMYNDFKAKHPTINFSYYLYRDVVSKMNISFAALGHEECFTCAAFKNHESSTNHDSKNLGNDCADGKSWNKHIGMAKSAREQYQIDAEVDNPNILACSADLQKVIMLPRCEMFKEVIFVPRIIAFNESIVPIGKKHKKFPTAVVWHEALSGRSKEDIISAFYAFFLDNRDAENIILWLDNCAAQNKNWTFFSFCVYLVNSADVALNTLTLKHFEPGHTFMSADSFHHQVEKSLKQMKKVYDFGDYKDAVQKANSSKVKLIEMKINNFFNWEDKSYQYKLSKINPRPYLSDMVQVNFENGKQSLSYKCKFDQQEATILNFLVAKHQKNGLEKPKCKTVCRGISQARKDTLINRLRGIIPITRINFWKNLPVSENPEQEDE
ncbi:unnamed protein product [Ceutorhynchus assimilis]|uniref:DUF7869 domain-containing protein n=1 Tax=Ceutorhynchus assimilis TaxID=467358 RepID=A0A9N9QSE6_9CUCU|nr:unnamed protein product [Ceutorhynchus assimilis]